MTAMLALSLEYGIVTDSWYAELAFRRRVSMSAIGSVIVMGLLPFLDGVSPSGDLRRSGYQLLLVTPGSSPRCAISRTQMRQSPNLRYTARGRPQRWHRLLPRTPNFGVLSAFWTRAVFAMSVLLVEGEAQTAEQRAALVVGGRGRHQGDVHAAHPVHAVGVDLVEHDLFGETERVVAATVELSRRQTAEVADPRKGQGDQPVDELPHPVAAQGRVRADRHALAQLELGDGLAGLRHLRLLTGDRGQILHRALDQLGVAGSLADAHVHHDLDQPRDLVDVAVGELLAQRRHDLLGAVADPGALLGLRVHQHHVADVDRGLDRLDATGPGAAAGLAGADMLGHPLHTLDDEAVGVLEDLQDASLLAAVATRDDDDKVALLDLGHGQSTSGANEMIFMNFLSRSSRPTGPKMRVPRGSLSTLRSTAAFSSNLMYEPSGRRRDLVVRTTTALTTSPFLTFPPGMASLTVATITSPIPA